MLAFLDAPPGATALDFGTGTATYAIALARLRPDLRFVALDEQPEMLAFARAKLEREPMSNITLAGTDALSALRAGVDRILALNVLHEVGDDALAAMRALLAPGGTIAFVDWNAAVERPVGPPRDHVYSPAEARARLEAQHFQITAERAFPYHYALRAV